MPALASRPYVVDNDVVSRLERVTENKVVIDGLPLIDGEPVKLELERFEVWAPDAKIIVYEADGKSTHTMPRPTTRFYNGHIAGNPDSTVTLSIGANGHLDGMIFVADRVFEIGRGHQRGMLNGGPVAHREDGDERKTPVLVREFDPVQDLVDNPRAENWHCDVEKMAAGGLHPSLMASLPDKQSGPKIAPNGTPASGVSYKLNLAIETDGELWAAFGSDGAVTTYLGDLISKASTIYQRDASTTLTMGTVHLWQNSGTDPWTVTPASGTSAALAEFGAYWHNNYSGVARSAVVMLSGKAFFGGVAWAGSQLCANDFFCGATGSSCGSATFANSYAGPYAFCGSINVVSTTTPDPTLTVNGIQFGLPQTNYWPLLEVCHELGHNANGPHTHCIALSGAQQTQYNVPGRTYVDLCYGSEGGCYSGSTSAPAEKGTIMSYCHNISSGGFPQSRFMFYKTGEANELVLPYLNTAMNNATSGLDATISGTVTGSNLTCGAAQTASVPANGSATFSWQVTGGTINGSSTTNALSFTPNAASVTVTITVTNAKGCAIVNSRTTSATCGAISAPTNVVATAASSTSVSLTWTASAGATKYHVYRSSNNSTYSQVNGELTTGTSYSDTTASASTAYTYKVRAVDGSNTESPDSNKDLATTVIFTDPTITAQSTTMKAVHITELRTAIDAVRKLVNAGVANPATYATDPTITALSTKPKALHITEMRTFLNSARSTLGLSAISYTDATITAFSTVIKKAHIDDLRNGVK